MSRADILSLLQDWKGLWTYPDLFASVHGSRTVDLDEEKLAFALLEFRVEESEPDAHLLAMERIKVHRDLASTERAVLLFLELGIFDLLTADRELDEATGDFKRRVDDLRRRAKRISARGNLDVESLLLLAEKEIPLRPREGERCFQLALARVANEEAREMEEIRSIVAGSDLKDRHLTRSLELALAARNLRLARAYRNRLDADHLDWRELDEEWISTAKDTDQQISWLLNPGLSPRWFAKRHVIDLSDESVERIMLEALQELKPDVEIDSARAKECFSLVTMMLVGQQNVIDAVAIEDDGSGAWVWYSTVLPLNKLFVLSPIGDQAVTVWRLPTKLESRLGAAGSRDVLLDLFGTVTAEASQAMIVVTRQMLVDLAEEASTKRSALFIRMLSKHVSVRTLLEGMVEKTPQELSIIWGGAITAVRSPILVNEAEFESNVRALLDALDLDFDEDDLAVLLDATAGRIKLLLLVLNAVARHFPNESVSSRLFDLADLCSSPEIDREIEEVVGKYIRSEFGESLGLERRRLEVIDEIFDLVLEENGRPWLERSELGNMLVQFAEDSLQISDLEKAESCIDRMVNLGLLRPAASEQGDSLIYRRNRSRVYDALLHASD